MDKLSENLNNVTIDKEVLKIQLKDIEEIKPKNNRTGKTSAESVSSDVDEDVSKF